MTASEANLGGLPIAAGDVLLKKYRVERLIGAGGTGIVLSATHVQLESRVAIKFLRRALADDELRTRFEREARAIGTIESEHVVLVLDTGALDDGSPYMVMEYLDGRDLARVIKEDGPLPVEEAVDCMLQVCEALGQAHRHGIVHRDLKPANLLLTRRTDGRVHVKVVDFGISKILDKALASSDDGEHDVVTTAWAVLGSPRWMAPEQIRSSKDVDGRADLWSAGAVLFQLISGKHAFEVEESVQVGIDAVLRGSPRKLVELVPGVAPELEAVVGKCLAKDVTQRYQTADELANALRPFASDRTKDSLDRIRVAKRSPNVRIAVEVASTSTPPTSEAEFETLPSGVRDAPTERRLRVAPLKKKPSDPSPVVRPSAQSTRPSVHGGRGISTIMLAAVSAGAFLVVFGGIVLFEQLGLGRATSDASPSPARFSAERTLPTPAGSVAPAGDGGHDADK